MKVFDVCFVCLGNICRSPAADGVARHLAQNLSYIGTIDSAGTGAWHVGEAPHHSMQRVAKENGIDLSFLKARKIQMSDFKKFDYLVAMDDQNYWDLKTIQPKDSLAQVVKLLEYIGEPDADVPDPYYGGPEGFKHTFELIYKGVQAFFEYLANETKS